MLIWSLTAGTSYGAGPLSISTPYPGISAQPGSSITFPLTINGSGFVDLEVTSAPSGWTTGIYGDGMEIHRVYVQGNDAARAELRVQIPSDVENGDYIITVEASGGGRAKLSLNIKIDADARGSDEIEVQYPSLSGPDTATFSFRGTLNNNSGVLDSTLGASAQRGWQISFSQLTKITLLFKFWNLENPKTLI